MTRSVKSHSRVRDEAAVGRRSKRERAARLATSRGVLVAKGYRIVGRRVRTGMGEIDLISVRGRRLAFVEANYRDEKA